MINTVNSTKISNSNKRIKNNYPQNKQLKLSFSGNDLKCDEKIDTFTFTNDKLNDFEPENREENANDFFTKLKQRSFNFISQVEKLLP